jgi:hypothetical protein
VSASEAIARLRELRAKATAGPWSTINDKSPYWIVNKNGDAELGTFAVARDVWWEANAAAIVAAMNSLPALLECASALRVLSWHYEELATMDGDVSREQLQAHDGPLKKARAALQALAGEGGE